MMEDLQRMSARSKRWKKKQSATPQARIPIAPRDCCIGRSKPVVATHTIAIRQRRDVQAPPQHQCQAVRLDRMSPACLEDRLAVSMSRWCECVPRPVLRVVPSASPTQTSFEIWPSVSMVARRQPAVWWCGNYEERQRDQDNRTEAMYFPEKAGM